MYTCLPPSNRNEWLNLKDSIDQYNQQFGTQYCIVSSPELQDRVNPQPELLLSDGRTRMVIERKILCWPPGYIRHHHLWHEFNQRFFAGIGSVFDDAVYVIEVSADSMPASKWDMASAVEQIVAVLLARSEEIKEVGEISASEPIPWSFFRMPNWERDEDTPERGLLARLKLPSESHYYSPTELDHVRPEVSARVQGILDRTVPKFSAYKDCARVLVLELYTGLFTLSIDFLEEITRTLELPPEIDRIWLAEVVEVNDREEEVVYRRAK